MSILTTPYPDNIIQFAKANGIDNCMTIFADWEHHHVPLDQAIPILRDILALRRVRWIQSWLLARASKRAYLYFQKDRSKDSNPAALYFDPVVGSFHLEQTPGRLAVRRSSGIGAIEVSDLIGQIIGGQRPLRQRAPDPTLSLMGQARWYGKHIKAEMAFSFSFQVGAWRVEITPAQSAEDALCELTEFIEYARRWTNEDNARKDFIDLAFNSEQVRSKGLFPGDMVVDVPEYCRHWIVAKVDKETGRIWFSDPLDDTIDPPLPLKQWYRINPDHHQTVITLERKIRHGS